MEKENYYSEVKNLPLGFKLLQFYFKYIGNFFPRISGMIFFKVFCKPKKRTIREKHIHFLNTSKKEIIDFETSKIQTYTWGSGNKTILIVHGWEGMSADFKEIITELIQAGFKVTAVDLPAHGKSSGNLTHIPMIMRLLKILIKKYDALYGIVSHSLGATATAFTMADFNGTTKLSKIVLMGLQPIPFVFFKQFRHALKVDDALFDKCLDYVRQKINLNVDDFSVAKITSEISAEDILLIHDEKDEVVNLKTIKSLHEGWEHSELFYGKHGGHYKHYKHKAVVEKVVHFMGQT